MSYKSWIEKHAIKHKNIINKLSHLTDDEVIKYFRYENMVKNEIDFCPLYKDNKKCHDIKELNCYLCACPNFRIKQQKSYCDINSIDGGQKVAKDGYIHQVCTKCTVPHNEDYIKDKFDRNWSTIMKNAIQDN